MSRKYEPYLGLRNPRFIKGYPLPKKTLIHRFRGGTIRAAELRQKRPRRHARPRYGTATHFLGGRETMLLQRAAPVDGSLEERVFYQALTDHGFMPEVDFTYQASEFGGRAELGGLVADFLFPVPMVVVQVQSYWHNISLEIEHRDNDQAAMLQALGFTVLEVWPPTIHDQAALDMWIENNISTLWGTSRSPLAGYAGRGQAWGGYGMPDFSTLQRELDKIKADLERLNTEPRLNTLESALFGGGGGPAVRISSGYIAQVLSSANYKSGSTGWRLTRSGDAEFNSIIARGTLQSSNFVSGSAGWRVNVDGDAEFNNVEIRGSIRAAAFQYNAASAVGGILIVAPASILTADISAAATTVAVQDAEFATGDFLFLKEGGSYEVMEVTAGGGTTTLTVTRGVDGTAQAWNTGTAIIRKGDRIVMDTVSSYTPYMDIIDFTGPNFNDESTVVRIGNLDGISDPDLNPAGFGLYTTNGYFKGTASFGGGAVTLEAAGIRIDQGEYYANSINWLNDEEVIASITGSDASGSQSLNLGVFDLESPYYGARITIYDDDRIDILPRNGGGYPGWALFTNNYTQFNADVQLAERASPLTTPVSGYRTLFATTTGFKARTSGGATHQIWDAGNDGPGSGLNADLLDGYHAASFLQQADVELISTITRSTDGNFAFTSIPSTYKHLIIVGQVRSNYAAYGDNITFRFNNDTASNYGNTWIRGLADGTVQAGGNSSDTSLPGATIEGNNANANAFSAIHVTIPNYTGAKWKSLIGEFGFSYGNGAAANMIIQGRGGSWKSTAAITRVDVFPYFGSNFKVGSTLSLYGVRG